MKVDLLWDFKIATLHTCCFPCCLFFFFFIENLLKQTNKILKNPSTFLHHEQLNKNKCVGLFYRLNYSVRRARHLILSETIYISVSMTDVFLLWGTSPQHRVASAVTVRGMPGTLFTYPWCEVEMTPLSWASSIWFCWCFPSRSLTNFSPHSTHCYLWLIDLWLLQAAVQMAHK